MQRPSWSVLRQSLLQIVLVASTSVKSKQKCAAEGSLGSKHRVINMSLTYKGQESTRVDSRADKECVVIHFSRNHLYMCRHSRAAPILVLPSTDFTSSGSEPQWMMSVVCRSEPARVAKLSLTYVKPGKATNSELWPTWSRQVVVVAALSRIIMGVCLQKINQ